MNLSYVDCPSLDGSSTVNDLIEETELCSHMSGDCMNGACTTCIHIPVEVVVLDSIARFIVVTSKDGNSHIPGKKIAHTCIRRQVMDQMLPRADFVHVQLAITMFGAAE